MNITPPPIRLPEKVEKANEEIKYFKKYLKDMEKNHPYEKPKTFKDTFGYEIILFEGGGYEFKDQNINKTYEKI